MKKLQLYIKSDILLVFFFIILASFGVFLSLYLISLPKDIYAKGTKTEVIVEIEEKREGQSFSRFGSWNVYFVKLKTETGIEETVNVDAEFYYTHKVGDEGTAYLYKYKDDYEILLKPRVN